MPEKTLLERLQTEPMISDGQVIKIQCKEDLDHYLPQLTLEFTVTLDKDGKHYVSKGVATIDERKSHLKKDEKLKEYSLGNGVYVYYSYRANSSDRDEIVSIVVEEIIEDPHQDAEKSNKELVEFLELAQDADAMQSYRSLAFYWTALQTGVSFNLGHMLIEYEDEIEDEDDIEGEGY